MFKVQRDTAVRGAFGALLLVAGASVFSSAQAGTISCPGTVATTDREFSLTTDPGTATCYASAPGNENGSPLLATLDLIDKTDDDDAYVGVNGELSTSPLNEGLSGTFTLTNLPAGYSQFVLVLKSGEGTLDPDWAAFLLPVGETSGSWTISGEQELSHASLYGVPSAVPLPAPFLLLAIAVGGLAAARWWRKRTMVQAA